jgi:RNA polymerase sigma factor (sigma-70 family)
MEKLETLATHGGAESVEFETFFAREYGRLFRTLVLVSDSEAEAEDLAQEAMARAWERWDRVRQTESPVSYVYRIALNLNRRRLRRLLSWRASDSELADEANRRSADPAGQAGDRHEVARLLSSIPLSQRQALVLVEWVGLTAEEAGAILGIAPASVRGRVHRARAALRKGRDRDDE